MGGDCPLSALRRFARRARGVLGILLGTRGTAHRARWPEHGPWTVASCVRHPACIDINWHRSLYCSGRGRMQHQPKPSVRSRSSRRAQLWRLSRHRINVAAERIRPRRTLALVCASRAGEAARRCLAVNIERTRPRSRARGYSPRVHAGARAARIGVLPFSAVLTGAIDIVCDREQCANAEGAVVRPGSKLSAQRSSSQRGLVPGT